MKRIVNIFLLIIFMSNINTEVFAYDAIIDGIYYVLWSNGEAGVTYRTTERGRWSDEYISDYSGNIIIPEYVTSDGTTYRVTRIYDHAFESCDITSITIPNSVTFIGSEAFHFCGTFVVNFEVTDRSAFCNNTRIKFLSENVGRPISLIDNDGNVIKEYIIPDDVSTIGESAFSYCSGLTSITIPNSVTSIGQSAFQKCSGLTSISIPTSVTSIEQSAFSGCSGLTSISIPTSVVSIGQSAFANCSGLTSIIIPNSVASIGQSVFSGCSGFTSISIPTSVTSIEQSAFSGCSSLTSIIIPNNVTSIGQSAFSGCRELTSLIVGSGVTSIGADAFKETNLKKSIWLTNTPPTGYSYAKGTINYVSNDQFDISNKVVYKFLSSYFDVDGIRYVPVSPSDRTCDAIDCLYNESAENVNIGQTITNKGITLIVQKVNPYTCYGNNYIKEVNLSLDGDIGENAFGGCTALSIATINNQGHIGSSSFSNCTVLSTVTISNQGDIGSSVFSGCTALKSATISNQGDIGSDAFAGCHALETVEIGKSVTSIGEEAFYNCSKLTGVILPDAVAHIGYYAFANCQAMTSVKMGNGLKTIGQYAFKGCNALPSITIPQAVTNINNYAFSGCTSLKEFKIADSETELTIGSNGNNPIFSSCPLETIYIGRNINYKTSSDYGYSPFYRNTSLKTVKITDKETEISENEFYGCTNLQSVTIGDGVTTIGNWAFSGCQSLKYFAFGSQVQTIGQEAFSDCSAVVEISSKAATPPTCGSQALDDINKWECKLFVPEGCMATYQDADQWKDFFFTDEGEGTSGQNPDNPSIDNPDGRKCEAPTISIVGGKIKFDCNTNGVLFHYNITCLDVKGGVINTSEVDIQKTYRISVYASKDGYDDSSTTTKDIKMISDGDLNDDGVINVADVVELTNIIMDQEQ